MKDGPKDLREELTPHHAAWEGRRRTSCEHGLGDGAKKGAPGLKRDEEGGRGRMKTPRYLLARDLGRRGRGLLEAGKTSESG